MAIKVWRSPHLDEVLPHLGHSVKPRLNNFLQIAFIYWLAPPHLLFHSTHFATPYTYFQVKACKCRKSLNQNTHTKVLYILWSWLSNSLIFIESEQTHCCTFIDFCVYIYMYIYNMSNKSLYIMYVFRFYGEY